MTRFTAVIVFFVALWVAVSAIPFTSVTEGPARYDGQFVIRALVDTEQKANLVNELGLDVWDASGIEWDIRVTQEQANALNAAGIVSNVYIDDLQSLIDRTAPKFSVMESADDFFLDYRSFNDIIAFYKTRAQQYPNLVTVVPSIGKSFEGRDIPAFRLKGRADGSRKIYWQGGIHAREWISPPTVAWQYEQLVTLYGKDSSATWILDNFEIVIVPVLNPDGYEYSRTNDRMWRKNRRTNQGVCNGVDLNRNWDAKWNTGGSSGNTCSDTYHGTGPFSEPESLAASNYIRNLGKVYAAIDFHAYSQLILRPYGYTSANSPDEALLKALGDGTRDAIYPVHGVRYTSQKSIDLYLTSGTASDWFYDGTKNQAWGFTIELRDTGRYGFLLPADQIIPQGEEIWAGMVYFTRYVFDKHAPIA